MGFLQSADISYLEMFVLHLSVFPKISFTQAATEVIKLNLGIEKRKSTLILTFSKTLFHHLPGDLESSFTQSPA